MRHGCIVTHGFSSKDARRSRRVLQPPVQIYDYPEQGYFSRQVTQSIIPNNNYSLTRQVYLGEAERIASTIPKQQTTRTKFDESHGECSNITTYGATYRTEAVDT